MISYLEHETNIITISDFNLSEGDTIRLPNIEYAIIDEGPGDRFGDGYIVLYPYGYGVGDNYDGVIVIVQGSETVTSVVEGGPNGGGLTGYALLSEVADSAFLPWLL